MCDESLSQEPWVPEFGFQEPTGKPGAGRLGKDRQIQGWSLKDPSLAMLFDNADTGSENAHHSLRRL